MKKKHITILLALCAVGAYARDLTLPSAVPDLANWALASYTLDVGKYMFYIQGIVQIIKMLVVAAGSKMKPKFTAGLTALVAFGTLLADDILADGMISGEEWGVVVARIISALLAFFGYKVLWSNKAPVNADD